MFVLCLYNGSNRGSSGPHSARRRKKGRVSTRDKWDVSGLDDGVPWRSAEYRAMFLCSGLPVSLQDSPATDCVWVAQKEKVIPAKPPDCVFYVDGVREGGAKRRTRALHLIGWGNTVRCVLNGIVGRPPPVVEGRRQMLD